MNNYIDAHCHLINDDSLPNILFTAYQSGVCGMINNAAKFSDLSNVIKLSNMHSNICGAIGVHPWYISDAPDNWADVIENVLIQNPKIQVGEIGLDKNRPDIDKQIDFFTRQLKIASKLQRGISVHCVHMWNKLIDILKNNDAQSLPYIILHSYNCTTCEIDSLCKKYNIYFSFSPRNITSKKITQILSGIPISKIIAESDSDNPKMVINVISEMAKILNIEQSDLADIIYKNTIRIFNNGQTL